VGVGVTLSVSSSPLPLSFVSLNFTEFYRFSHKNGRICVEFCHDWYMQIADCYRLLGLRVGASHEDVKAAYRRLARLHHPDANPNHQQAKEKFIQITEAYRYLTSVVPSPRASQPVARQTPESCVTPSQSESNGAPAPSPNARSAAGSSPPSIRTTHLTPSDRALKQESYVQLQQLLREQQFPRAVTLIENLVHRLPRDTEIQQWQAITYQRFGRYLVSAKQPEKAKRYLHRALRIAPHNQLLRQEIERELQRIGQVEA
jgi:tetratricopeptide (TPR) repeat protein